MTALDGFAWTLLRCAVPLLLVLQMLPVMIWFERKGSAYIADRTGPNRAFIPGLGLRLAGMVHNLTDVVKLLTKEEVIPNHVNRRLYVAAPMIAVMLSLMVGAVIPLTPRMALDGGYLQLQAVDAGIGFLYILALSSLGVYAVTLAGWASNNKYSIMGGLRASAQMISYELSIGLALVALFMVFGTVDLVDMVAYQGTQSAYWVLPAWGIFVQPIGFVLFLIGGFAETNRNPFDMAEGESEIVGFHVEYGAIKFALFMMAEYVHMVIISLLIATCYFGGYEIPWVDSATLAQPDVAAGVLKVLLVATMVVCGFIGFRLLAWHKVNRNHWKDSRRREGAVLAVLMGFAPAVTAAIAMLLWGGELGVSGASILGGVIGFLILMLKTLFFCWLFIWVRWTLPRFRYDQLMSLGWKVLVPLGLANILLTGLLIKMGVW